MLMNRENPQNVFFMILAKNINCQNHIYDDIKNTIIECAEKISPPPNGCNIVFIHQDHLPLKKLVVVTSRELSDDEKESFRKECNDDFDDISFWAW